MCLERRQLSRSTLLASWLPVLLYHMFHCHCPGFILQTMCSWVGEAANGLTPLADTSLSFLKDANGAKVRPTFETPIIIVIGVEGG